VENKHNGRAEFFALPANRLPDPLHPGGMFAVVDNRSKPQLSRWFRQLDPGTTTSKRFLKRQTPHRRDAKYPDHSKVETLGVVISESLFQHLRLQNVKIGKWF